MFRKMKENLHQIQAETKEYVDANLAYYKLWLFKVITKSASSVFKLLLIGLSLAMLLVFFSIAAALAIGYALDNLVYGFLIIAGVYLLLTIILFNLKDKIEQPIIKKLSDIFYNDED